MIQMKNWFHYTQTLFMVSGKIYDALCLLLVYSDDCEQLIENIDNESEPQLLFLLLAPLISLFILIRLYKHQLCFRFGVFTAMIMKNAVLWDVTPYGSCK
jgi:hypothetical protein